MTKSLFLCDWGCETGLETRFSDGFLQLCILNEGHRNPRCGNIKATIWQNNNEKGPFFATTFSRPFKDQFGAWRNGTSFGPNDLEALVTVAREAREWISTHALKR